MSLLGAVTDTGDIVNLLASNKGEQVTMSRSWPMATQVIPGIGTGAAYVAGDAFGDVFTFVVPVTGFIHGIVFHDLSNLKIAKTLFLYDAPVTATADNAAYAPSGTALRQCVGVISIGAGDFYAANANAVAVKEGLNIRYEAPQGKLWCQIRTEGADTVVAGALPSVKLKVF